jgi:diguanylate cyclase (GGDEF)-like protein
MRKQTAMLELSWVGKATRTAKTVVIVAYASTALLVGALALERLTLHNASMKAVNEVKAALKLADTILLEDERLTMSANMAAATGEPRWIQRYEAHIPAIDAAIREATTMAPPGAAQRFDRATREANDRLVEMEREAFARVAAADLPSARAVLASPAYAEQKTILATGSDTFMDELQSAVDARLSAVESRSWALLAAMFAVAAAGFVLLWRRLNDHLARSEAAFALEQAKVSRLALHDTLTGLANRRYLQLQLDGSIARAQRDGSAFALMVIDLDGFKPINDRYGHSAGDAVLMEISRRLKARVRKDEMAARLGGDEFVIVLNHSGSSDEPLRAAQRLIGALSQPVRLPQGEVRVGASVGVAFYPTDSVDPEDLIRKADVALYRAKDEGGGEVRFFQQSMDEEVRERAALELDLREAIAHDQIVPYFQPLMDLSTGTLTGFEVLARWIHPSRGVIPPGVFVPIAEDTGQIDALTVRVMRAALTSARDWDPRLTIAINIAPQQLKNEALVDNLLKVLSETGFPASRFEIEITENALIDDLELARRIVLAIKGHGIRVALDDFGTGYSSLSHLSELPFDKIKIDRSFIHTLHERPESATIVTAIIGLGRSLNLPTTAEGIESHADADVLTRLGCNSGQGFLYSKPVPAAEAVLLIARFDATVAPHQSSAPRCERESV